MLTKPYFARKSEGQSILRLYDFECTTAPILSLCAEYRVAERVSVEIFERLVLIFFCVQKAGVRSVSQLEGMRWTLTTTLGIDYTMSSAISQSLP